MYLASTLHCSTPTWHDIVFTSSLAPFLSQGAAASFLSHSILCVYLAAAALQPQESDEINLKNVQWQSFRWVPLNIAFYVYTALRTLISSILDSIARNFLDFDNDSSQKWWYFKIIFLKFSFKILAETIMFAFYIRKSIYNVIILTWSKGDGQECDIFSSLSYL